MPGSSSIITGGLGPNQRLILQGYGRRLLYLVKQLYESLTIVGIFSRIFYGRKTFIETFRIRDAVSPVIQIIEIIPEVFRRVFIPRPPRPWQMRVWVAGNTKFLITFPSRIRGSPKFFRKMQIRAVGNLRCSYITIRYAGGKLLVPFKSTIRAMGSPVFKFTKSVRTVGNLSKKYTKEILAKGKKTFKRFFEVLS